MSWNPQDAAQRASISPWDARLSVTGTRMGKWWPHPGQPCNDRHQEQAVLATGTLGYPIPILLISPDKPCLLFNNVSAIGKWPQVCQFHPLVFIMQSFFPFIYGLSNADQTGSPFTPRHHSLICFNCKIIKISHRNALSTASIYTN